MTETGRTSDAIQARPLIVQKYGGSSVATAEMIRKVAAKICARRSKGCDLVVVVSAMGDTTDELIALARQVVGDGATPEAREMDTLLSTGELVSATLMAMAIRSLGYDVVSLSGIQAGIRTDTKHGAARIAEIDPARLQREIAGGRIVVVAGFQGLAATDDITTLGRGGSDTTAVALAAQLGANRCEIYTDVDGIYTADPRLVPEAHKLSEVGFEEMLELASLGAKMNPRSIELGAIYGVPVLVASTFQEVPGTLIHGQPQPGSRSMEIRNAVTAVETEPGVARIAIGGIVDRSGLAAEIFGLVANAGINVDVILSNETPRNAADLTFTVQDCNFEGAKRCVSQVDGAEVTGVHSLGKISIVGTGMQNSPGYAARMFRVLAEEGINIELITTGEIRITCVIEESALGRAAATLSRAFDAPVVELPRPAKIDSCGGREIALAGVAVDRKVGRIAVQGVEDRPGVAASLFEPLADAGMSIDLIVQTAAGDRLTDMAFTVAEDDGPRARDITTQARALKFRDVVWNPGLAKVSIVSAELRDTPGQAARMFKAMADAGVNIRAITTSDIRITCLVSAEDAGAAARALHGAFKLAAERADR